MAEGQGVSGFFEISLTDMEQARQMSLLLPHRNGENRRQGGAMGQVFMLWVSCGFFLAGSRIFLAAADDLHRIVLEDRRARRAILAMHRCGAQAAYGLNLLEAEALLTARWPERGAAFAAGRRRLVQAVAGGRTPDSCCHPDLPGLRIRPYVQRSDHPAPGPNWYYRWERSEETSCHPPA